jgi:superfamily II DNA/RNA helicase
MNIDQITIPASPDSPPEIRSWDDLNLKHELLRGIYAYGFEIPSEIQKKAILPIILKRDIIAQAQSGSGKTGTFSIGVLENIDLTQQKTQAIILAPTHELAKQIAGVIQSLGNMMINVDNTINSMRLVQR